MYASKRAGKDRVTGVPIRSAGPSRHSGVASLRERQRRPTPAQRPRLLDPRHPRGVARAADRPDADERADLPDRDLRLGRRRRARPRRRRRPGRLRLQPHLEPDNERPRGAYAELAGGGAGVALASGMARHPRGARVAAPGRRPDRRAARDLRVDAEPADPDVRRVRGPASTSSTRPTSTRSPRRWLPPRRASSTPRPSPTRRRSSPITRPSPTSPTATARRTSSTTRSRRRTSAGRSSSGRTWWSSRRRSSSAATATSSPASSPARRS